MNTNEAKRQCLQHDIQDKFQVNETTRTNYRGVITELCREFPYGSRRIYPIYEYGIVKHEVNPGYRVFHIAKTNYRRVCSQVHRGFVKMQYIKARLNYRKVMRQLRLVHPSKVSESVLASFREECNISTVQQANHDAIVMRLRREAVNSFTITRNYWRGRRLNALERSNCEFKIDQIGNDIRNKTKMTEFGWKVRIDRSLELKTFDDVLVQFGQEIPEILRLIQEGWDISIGQSIARGNYSVFVLPQLLRTCTSDFIDTMRFTRERRERRLAFLMGSHIRLGSESEILNLEHEFLWGFLTKLNITHDDHQV
jgi:hypothetical protein